MDEVSFGVAEGDVAGLPRWRNWPAYGQIAGIAIQMAYAYRVNLAFELLRILLRIYLLKVLWTAVYAGQGVVAGMALRQVIAFITLAQLQIWVLSPVVADNIRERVRAGTIALDLARPAPFLGQMLAQQLGWTAALLPFVLLAVPLALIVGGLAPPASLPAGLVYLLSLGLGYLVSVLIGLVMGLVSFWTLQTWGVTAIYGYVNQFFTGALVPLGFFPLWLRHVAELLPFQAQAFIPISLYMGNVAPKALPGTIGVQVLWVAVLAALVLVLWWRAVRRVVIQGG